MIVGANAPEISKKALALNSGGAVGGGKTATASTSATGGGADTRTGTGGGGDLQTRLKLLVNKERVMLFMKGSPGAEKCGFSRTIVSLLKQEGVTYGLPLACPSPRTILNRHCSLFTHVGLSVGAYVLPGSVCSRERKLSRRRARLKEAEDTWGATGWRGSSVVLRNGRERSKTNR